MAMIDFAEFLAAKRLSERTIREYLYSYRQFDKGLEDQELNQSYINKFLLSHTSSITSAFLLNLFEFLEIKHLKIPKITGRKKHKKRKYLTPQDIKVLRNWIYHNRNIKYLLCLDLSYSCALRRSEVMGIMVRDFDLKNWAEDSSKPCKLLIRGKGNKERYVAVPSKLMFRIIDHIEELDKDLDDKLFKFHYKQWDKNFRDAVKNTMDYKFTLHDLRRSRATYWLKNGVGLMDVKVRLGHNSVQTTQLYINLDEEEAFDKWVKEL